MREAFTPRASADDLRADVYDIVAQIPRGRVLSYGDVARLAGHPTLARLVGRIMATVPPSLRLPCHRVVSSSGRLAPGWTEQAARLREEGVEVKLTPKGELRIDIKKHKWTIQ